MSITKSIPKRQRVNSRLMKQKENRKSLIPISTKSIFKRFFLKQSQKMARKPLVFVLALQLTGVRVYYITINLNNVMETILTLCQPGLDDFGDFDRVGGDGGEIGEAGFCNE